MVCVDQNMAEGNSEVQLFSYWRSSCSYRLRIVLNMKKIGYNYNAVNLLAGEHKTEEFLAKNPRG
jgi:maleylacetoacetate isomerase